MLFRLRWAGAHPNSPTPFHCRCGFPSVRVKDTTTRDMVMHLAGCRKNGGPTKRHHFVRDALANIMRRAGYTTQTEVNLDPKGELRMDIVAVPHEGQTLYIDTTVANSTCRSHNAKGVDAILAKKDAEKTKKYRAAATAANANYMTFSMDIYGHMACESKNFLSDLIKKVHTRCADQAQTAASTASTTKLTLSKALAFGNGLCLLQSHQLHLLGVNLRSAPVAVTVPVPLVEEPEPENEFFCPPGLEDEEAPIEDDEVADATAEPSVPVIVSSQASLARAHAPHAQSPERVLGADHPNTAPAPQAPNTNINNFFSTAAGAASPVQSSQALC
jgi:hypothetical protein